MRHSNKQFNCFAKKKRSNALSRFSHSVIWIAAEIIRIAAGVPAQNKAAPDLGLQPQGLKRAYFFHE